MDNSKLFTLLVTPSILEEQNYVMSTEYPAAINTGKLILPVEKIESDHGELIKKYPELPKIIDANNEEFFKTAFLDAVKDIVRYKHEDPMHNYLIGLAYLEECYEIQIRVLGEKTTRNTLLTWSYCI